MRVGVAAPRRRSRRGASRCALPRQPTMPQPSGWGGFVPSPSRTSSSARSRPTGSLVAATFRSPPAFLPDRYPRRDGPLGRSGPPRSCVASRCALPRQPTMPQPSGWGGFAPSPSRTSSSARSRPMGSLVAATFGSPPALLPDRRPRRDGPSGRYGPPRSCVAFRCALSPRHPCRGARLCAPRSQQPLAHFRPRCIPCALGLPLPADDLVGAHRDAPFPGSPLCPSHQAGVGLSPPPQAHLRPHGHDQRAAS